MDLLHSLSKQQRKEYLLNGFIKNHEKMLKFNNNAIPDEIRNLMHRFLYIDIESNTEIKLKKEWRSCRETGRRHKVVVLGAGGVGKSAITMRMVLNEWRSECDPTIEDSYECLINIDSTHYILDILDTAQQEQFAAPQRHWISEAETYLLVYSVSSEMSLRHAQEVWMTINRQKEGEDDR
eukprot:212688_1